MAAKVTWSRMNLDSGHRPFLWAYCQVITVLQHPGEAGLATVLSSGLLSARLIHERSGSEAT